MKVIGLCGFIGSGKDTVANILKDEKSFHIMSFASVLKDIVSIVFNWDRQMLEGNTESSRLWREEIDTWWSKRLNIPNLSPRFVLQQWGTNVLRHYFHPDIWIASLQNKLLKINVDTIVITDCRFTNEIETLKALPYDVKFLWIRRSPIPLWTEDYIKFRIIPGNIHPSEYQWLSCNFNFIIENNGTIKDLKEQILNLPL